MSDRTAGYWGLVCALCLFGIMGIFSIGMPFLLVGITLAVVSPWRTRPAVLWPAVAAVVAFMAGFILVTPLGCTTSPSSVPSSVLSTQRTTCSNVLGIDYSGSGLYNPSLAPALLAGLALSVLAAVAVRVILRRRECRRNGSGAS